MSIALPHLDHLAVIHFSGADATSFLHGQLSCHVADLATPASTYGSYNTAKGRMLATFLLLRRHGGFDMLIDRGIAAAVAKRLQMFVLRSQVQIADVTAERVLLALSGEAAPAALAALNISLGDSPHAAIDRGPDGIWTRLDSGRALGLVPPEAAAQWADRAGLGWLDSVRWRRADIHAGVPWIEAATQDALTPHMANLDLIGGVHFDKGCYPGQEIVARTQHLGKVKRRMVVGHIDDVTAAPAPGDAVVGADLGDQASGLIVNVAPSARGGHDVLAVMQSSTIAARQAHLRSLDGPAIDIGVQPYPLGV